MAVDLTKDSIDLGIVVSDPESALTFYRDVLGFEHQGEMALGGGTVMHRLRCGSSLIKLVAPSAPPLQRAPPGGLMAATGYRYWTLSVANLDEMVERCRKAGHAIPVQPREIRPGVRIAMVEDPEGNWVEFLET